MKPGDLAVLQCTWWTRGAYDKRVTEEGIQCFVLAYPHSKSAFGGWQARKTDRFPIGTVVVCTNNMQRQGSSYIQFMVAGRLVWAEEVYLELLA